MGRALLINSVDVNPSTRGWLGGSANGGVTP